MSVRLVELAQKGRGLVALQDFKAGDVVLSELPTVLVVDEDMALETCSHCLRLTSNREMACAVCHCVTFCDSTCRASGEEYHKFECSLLLLGKTCRLKSMEMNHLRFAARALQLGDSPPLSATGTSGGYGGLMNLCSGRQNVTKSQTKASGRIYQVFSERASRVLQTRGADSEDAMLDLILKDIQNSFGIMAPNGPDGARRVRGYGTYLTLSFLNHDCLPNLARFDYYDAPGPNNALMTFRALEDIAAGSELTTSYFQANLPLEERRDILTEYGFACACERCVEERSAEDEEVPRIAAWMQRHICSVEDCGGTLAASPGSLDMECNMCGAVRTTKE